MRTLLLPYRQQFVDNTSTFFGSVEHYLGLLGALEGDWSASSEAFEAALAAHSRLASPPLLARTQLEYRAGPLPHAQWQHRARR